MATVVFPSDLVLARSSAFKYDNRVTVDILSDGTPRQRILSTSQYVSIDCKIEYLFLAEKDILVDFLTDHAADTVLWTIDDILYSGVFRGGYAVNMIGSLFTVTFEYYGMVV